VKAGHQAGQSLASQLLHTPPDLTFVLLQACSLPFPCPTSILQPALATERKTIILKLVLDHSSKPRDFQSSVVPLCSL